MFFIEHTACLFPEFSLAPELNDSTLNVNLNLLGILLNITEFVAFWYFTSLDSMVAPSSFSKFIVLIAASELFEIVNFKFEKRRLKV